MITLLLSAALAWGGTATTYVQPHLNLSAVHASGRSWAQLSGGATVGMTGRIPDASPLVWRARARGIGLYGLDSGSLGVDARVGAFAGPSIRKVVTLHGPDLFYSAYGRPSSADYHLPGTAGVALHNEAVVRLSKPVGLLGWFDPAWVFNPARNAHIGPFHELRTGVGLSIRSAQLHAQLGYQWAWNAAGRQDGVVLSAGL
ncbi:MAG: hypothetical protein JXX28_10175 [Deltaproteobacteria bacterium]|nr:hypothetical protein [Deltaproteobacteria bacterium]